MLGLAPCLIRLQPCQRESPASCTRLSLSGVLLSPGIRADPSQESDRSRRLLKCWIIKLADLTAFGALLLSPIEGDRSNRAPIGRDFRSSKPSAFLCTARAERPQGNFSTGGLLPPSQSPRNVVLPLLSGRPGLSEVFDCVACLEGRAPKLLFQSAGQGSDFSIRRPRIGIIQEGTHQVEVTIRGASQGF